MWGHVTFSAEAQLQPCLRFTFNFQLLFNTNSSRSSAKAKLPLLKFTDRVNVYLYKHESGKVDKVQDRHAPVVLWRFRMLFLCLSLGLFGTRFSFFISSSLICNTHQLMSLKPMRGLKFKHICISSSLQWKRHCADSWFTVLPWPWRDNHNGTSLVYQWKSSTSFSI